MRFERLMEQLVAVLALVVLAVGTLLVIAPFITTLLWSAILAYCTWGPYQRLSQAFHGHRAWAGLFITLAILCVILGPMFYVGIVFSTHLPDLVSPAQDRRSVAAGDCGTEAAVGCPAGAHGDLRPGYAMEVTFNERSQA